MSGGWDDHRPMSPFTYRHEARYDLDHTILPYSMQQYFPLQHFSQLQLFVNFLLRHESDIISNQKQFHMIAEVTLPPFILDTFRVFFQKSAKNKNFVNIRKFLA